MKTEPVFCGKIHVTAVKNGKWFWYDYITNAQQDSKILAVARHICPESYTTSRQHISQHQGEAFRATIEKAIGEKLNLPEDGAYSVTHAQGYNPVKGRDSHSILLFCEEKFLNGRNLDGDRTAIDIYI